MAVIPFRFVGEEFVRKVDVINGDMVADKVLFEVPVN